MKLIPVYSWNKTRLHFSKSSLRHLADQPWFQGALLLVSVIVAMLLANLPATKVLYHEILETQVTLHMVSPEYHIDSAFPRDMNIEKLINDILMVIFFFTVGLEIKREVAYGELSSAKKAMLPVIAAFGGVIFPALIYFFINNGTPAASGWGIPTATDIAFAVCILSALGDRVPVSMKVFLTALAIADDLIAILVVAIFYGGSINFVLLGIALALILVALLMRKTGEKHMVPYLLIAFCIWVLFYYGGIHATMAGVVMAFVIPNRPVFGKDETLQRLEAAEAAFHSYHGIESGMGFPAGPQRHYMREMKKAIDGSMNMSYKLERALSPWVNYLIMPLFALANAGVEISGGAGFGTVGLGIVLGLMLGKPLGITIFSAIAIKLGVGEKPAGTSWAMFFAVACLGGIGFTMSIFVDTLSFGDQLPAVMEGLRASGKIAVLLGSVCSAVLGSLLVTLVSAFSHKK